MKSVRSAAAKSTPRSGGSFSLTRYSGTGGASPRSGDGNIVLGINGGPKEMKITNIVWTGDTFTSIIPTDQIGDITFTGSLDRATGIVTVTLNNKAIPNIELKGGAWTGAEKRGPS